MARLARLLPSVVLALISHPLPANAIPTFNEILVFTDNRPLDDPFGISGYRVSLQAFVSDPLGVPGNISSVTARNLSSGEVRSLPFAAGEAGVFQGPYIDFLPFDASRQGVWEFRATNRQGEVAVRQSHNLDTPLQLPLPQNIRVQDPRAAPLRVTFDPVPGANTYTLEVFNGDLVGLFRTPFPPNPNFQVPAGIFTPGERYILRARAAQLDFTEPFTPGVTPVENRSVNSLDFLPLLPPIADIFPQAVLAPSLQRCGILWCQVILQTPLALSFIDAALHVGLKLTLGGNSTAAPRALRESGIENIWSDRFNIHDPAAGVDYPIRLDVDFVEDGFIAHEVLVAVGDGRPTATLVYRPDLPRRFSLF